MAQGDELGTDFYCLEDITDDLAYEEDPIQAYVQACYRRLAIKVIFYVDPYGVGMYLYVLETGAESDQIRSDIIAALLLDERTQNVEVEFVGQRIRIHVTPRLGVEFKFTLEIDRVAQAIITED